MFTFMLTSLSNTIFIGIFILHEEYVVMACKIPLICMLSFLISNGADDPMTDFYDRWSDFYLSDRFIGHPTNRRSSRLGGEKIILSLLRY